MDIKAIATDSGHNILESGYYKSIQEFVIIGHKSHDDKDLEEKMGNTKTTYKDVKNFVIHKDQINKAYYDEYEQLTFDLLLPYELEFPEYIYGIGLIALDDNNNEVLVFLANTPKIQKYVGLGGVFTYKVNVSGHPGKLIFNNSTLVSPQDLEFKIIEVKEYFQNIIDTIYKEIEEKITHNYKDISIGNIGDITYSVDKRSIKNRLYCDGSVFSPYLYPEFYSYWQTTSMGNSYSSGYCGRDHYTGWPRLPDLRGVFLRSVDDYKGYGAQSTALAYQDDAIRNITGELGPLDDHTSENVNGAFYIKRYRSYDARSVMDGKGFIVGFDASKVVPVASENRVKSKAVYPYITVSTKL